MRELHWTAKTEQKLALGGWHSANALALLYFYVIYTIKCIKIKSRIKMKNQTIVCLL